MGEPERAFFYGHTFLCGNPHWAPRLRLEVLKVFEEEELVARDCAQGEVAAYPASSFAGARESVRSLAFARSLGMIGALDLEGEEGYLADAGWRVFDEARQAEASTCVLWATSSTSPRRSTFPMTTWTDCWKSSPRA